VPEWLLVSDKSGRGFNHSFIRARLQYLHVSTTNAPLGTNRPLRNYLGTTSCRATYTPPTHDLLGARNVDRFARTPAAVTYCLQAMLKLYVTCLLISRSTMT
jgi:hypothetical protein